MWMLLHGFTGSPDSWDAVIGQADFDQSPLAPALLGHRARGCVSKATSFSEEVSRLAELASVVDPPRLLCGYSLGARLGLGLLSEHPALFDAAILIGVHPGLEGDAERARRRASDASRARALREEGVQAFVAAWEALPLFRTQRALSDEALAQQRDIRSSHDAGGLARSLEVLGLAEMPAYGATVSSIDVPVTLMAGSRDDKFCKLARGLARDNPRFEPLFVEGAGHNLLIEAPEAVASAIDRANRRAQEGVPR